MHNLSTSEEVRYRDREYQKSRFAFSPLRYLVVVQNVFLAVLTFDNLFREFSSDVSSESIAVFSRKFVTERSTS